jgi:SAM-dependent methyltransferase
MENEDKALYEDLQKELAIKFEGWDFSYFEKNQSLKEYPIEWNYRYIVESNISENQYLLDLGTGGGEFLSSLKGLPKHTFATEGYIPNVELAKNRLNKIGIDVREILDNIIPYDDNEFDIVINRHESYLESEICRVLKKDGIYITQQVGGLNDIELCMWFDVEHNDFDHWCMNKAAKQLEKSGIKITDQKECITKQRFFNIKAVIYYLKCIPWLIDDFSLEKYWIDIKRLNKFINTNGHYDVTNHRFLIVGEKK